MLYLDFITWSYTVQCSLYFQIMGASASALLIAMLVACVYVYVSINYTFLTDKKEWHRAG